MVIGPYRSQRDGVSVRRQGFHGFDATDRELLPNRLLARVSDRPGEPPAVLVSVGLLSLFVLSSALTRMTPDAAHRGSFAMIVRESLSPGLEGAARRLLSVPAPP